MRNVLLASAAAVGLALAAPAMAQTASNINPADTHSTIAPKLPTPPVSTDAGPRQFLQTARDALAGNRTGEAQEALERAEARLLDRSTANPGVADRAPMVRHVTDAREALGRGDVAAARQIIDAALATPMKGATQASAAPMGAAMPSAAVAASASGAPPSAIAGMPAAGVTVYDGHEIPLPSTDDSMSFSGKSGDNSYTARVAPKPEDPAEDMGSGANSSE